MSGHSKWSTIKRKKGAKDAARGKLFAKLAKGIEVAAREGGGDQGSNATLAHAIEKAKAQSMPHDNIERAIKRGTGEVEGAVYEEMYYEGYAPGGVALYVQVLTDNRNRAASAVRSTFSRNNGNLGEPGSVAYLFEQKGYFLVEGDEDEVMTAALDGGAEDVLASGSQWEITTAPSDFKAVNDALGSADLVIDNAEVTQIPTTSVPVDAIKAPQVLRLIDALDDLDDVQAVFANFDISDDVMAEVAG